jgi:hypothetical protein
MSIEKPERKKRFIRLLVNIAEKSLLRIRQAIGFTVQGGVMLMQDEKLTDGKEDIIAYKLAMSMAESMLKQGIITAEEFNKIEQIICEKYCINISSVFRYYA